jgi:hypothetical protein
MKQVGNAMHFAGAGDVRRACKTALWLGLRGRLLASISAFEI